MANETAAATASARPTHRIRNTDSGAEPDTPWVINLRAAMTSLRAEVAPLPGLECLRTYEVARVEEGRPRHRLRLGFFDSRAAAEAALPGVRTRYPAAFAAPAGRDDLANVGDFELVPRSVVPQPAPQTAELADGAVLRLLEPDAAVTAVPEANRVPYGRGPAVGRASDAFELSLVDDKLPTARTAPSAGARAADDAAIGDEAECYALELAVAAQPPKPGKLPHLDIFAAYALYSVEVTRGTRRLHAIRLGFFKERISATQVASYVRSAFPDVDVVAVATAEQTRHAALVPMPGAARSITAVELHAPESNVIELARTRQASPTPAAGAPALPSGHAPATHSRIEPPRPNGQRAAGTYADFSRTGKHKTLGQLLVEEARQVALSESAIRRMPAHKKTLFNKLVGRLKR